MPVNKEELVKDLATPEYQELIVKELPKLNFAIRTTAEEAAYQKTLTDKVVNDIHKKYDEDGKELFGDLYKSEPNERSYDTIKRVGKAVLKANADKVTELTEAIKKGDTSGALKKQLEDAQNSYAAKLKELTDELTTVKSGNELSGKQLALSTAYADVAATFKKALPPMFDITKNSVLDGLLKNSILKDGKLYSAVNGVIERDATFKELEMTDKIKTIFKDVIDSNRAKGGAGSADHEDGKKTDPATITAETYLRGDNVKTPEDLVNQMVGDGLVQGSDQFNKIYRAHVDTKAGVLRATPVFPAKDKK